MSWEVGAQRAQEAHHAGGDVLGRGEVRGKWDVVVYRAHRGRFKDRWKWWWVSEATLEVEEQGDEQVHDARVVYTAVAVGVDGNESLVWF